MRRFLVVAGSAAAGLVLAVALASAQTQTTNQPKKPAPKPQPVPVRTQPKPAPGQPQSFAPPFANDPLTVSADLVEAMRLAAVNPEAALALLHKLNARTPNRDDILTRLAYTLQAVEKTDSAAYYYKQALAVNPLNLEAGKALGSIYFADGQEQQAMNVFNGLLAANAYSLPAYRMVSTAIRDLGRPDEAVVLLEQGRARAKGQDPSGRNVGAFTVEIASYYKQLGDSRRALDEYLDYAAAEPRNFRFVRDRMIQVIADDDRNRTALVSYMQTRVDKGGAGSFIAADVLAAYHLQQGELESALDMAMRADADKMSDGASLLSIGQDAIDRAATRPRVERGRYYDLALRSLETYTQKHPQSQMMDRAHFLLAGVYAAYGSGVNATVPAAQRASYLEKSVNEYAIVSKQFAGGDLAEQAYLERGDVLLRKLKRPKDAMDVYRAGSVQARRTGTTYAGRIANIYIATGSPGDAEHYLKSLSQAEQPSLAQAGQYYSGLYLVTQKKYDAARDTLSSLAEKAPFSEFTNDAIEVAWVLQEGLQLKSQSLDDYSATLKADMVGDTTAVVSHLQAIANRDTDDPLRPRALKELGTVLFEAGDYDGSIANLRKFLADYPQDDDCAEVQRSIGHTYEVGLGQYADALKEYEHVLVTYPDYAMLDDLRHDVERVRGYQGSYAQ
ncbi:MAG TPA: tetratricopeptide repeat protein [Candidatus Krumholzibacteria bacterium]|nr:tetratricopeptide repeat protein [Candidatus Krumholzibacteria bacterium]